MTVPRLILLPGLDGTGALFAPLLAALPLDLPVRVVRYPDSAATYADHVDAARAELPRDEPFVLLGESFSGPVAVKLAHESPRNLRGLILCASFLTCPNRLLRVLRRFIPVASPKLVPRFIARHFLLGRFATRELLEIYRHSLTHASSPALTARLRSMSDVDVRAELRGLELPSLYLRATRDRLVGASFGEQYLTTARHGRLVDIDAPHFLLQARPRVAADEVLAFLRAAPV